MTDEVKTRAAPKARAPKRAAVMVNVASAVDAATGHVDAVGGHRGAGTVAGVADREGAVATTTVPA